MSEARQSEKRQKPEAQAQAQAKAPSKAPSKAQPKPKAQAKPQAQPRTQPKRAPVPAPVWASALLVIVLILSLPLWGHRIFLLDLLQQALLAASAMLLGFASYSLYQRKVIKTIRRQLDQEAAERARLETAVQTFHQMTLLDPLTGLYNEHFLEQHLAKELARCERHGYSLNVMKIDLKDFRKINSFYGRDMGDEVLKEFAERVRRSTRSSDFSLRTANDEFVVMLPESGPEWVPHIMARMSGLELNLNGEKVPITFAVGWTTFRKGEKAKELMARVEQELASDKQTGRSAESIRQAQADRRNMQSAEAMGRLAGRVAHDFNNLLNLVKGYSELMLDSVADNDPMREYVEQIHQANERATALTRQLLAFSRNQEARQEYLEMNTLLTGMEGVLRRLVGDQVELMIANGETQGPIRGNRGQIEQIILDLAVHACGSMSQGGRLTLQAQTTELDEAFTHWHPGAKTGSYVMLSVLDNGAGLDAETRANIFEPFNAPKERARKNGMGLAGVYGMVKQNSGYIWVDSEPGLGTRFSLYFPRAEKPVEVH